MCLVGRLDDYLATNIACYHGPGFNSAMPYDGERTDLVLLSIRICVFRPLALKLSLELEGTTTVSK
jgi:hypothetical protein